LTGTDLTPFLITHPEVALRSVQWEETGANALEHRFIGTARVRFRGTERTVELPLSVKVDHHTCPECSRRSGHYYTAVLQLRPALNGPREKAGPMHERLDRAWAKLMGEARDDWRKAVSWRETRPEGWDYFIVDTLAARALARLARLRLGVSIKESATLVGRKDGVDVYRVTFCLRLPTPPPPEGGAEDRGPDGVEQYS
jgi:NMD protein affecting ribosome stability and mRNA decay